MMTPTAGAYAPAANGTPPPQQSAARGGGAGVLGALLVGQALVVLGFFGTSLVAVWMQATSSGESTGKPPAYFAAPEPAATPSGVAWIGVVVPTKANLPGRVRAQPAMDGQVLTLVPIGDEVDVLSAQPTGAWYRVRTRSPGAQTYGFMHKDVLRRK